MKLTPPPAMDEVITSLPPTWDVHKPQEATSSPLEARRYIELASTLTTLSTKRQEALERVARLRRMAALLAPFESSPASSLSPTADPPTQTTTSSVQENLITRNGEIERELERMRLLLARVAGRVAQLPDKRGAPGAVEDKEGGESMDVDSLEREKVERLLDLL